MSRPTTTTGGLEGSQLPRAHSSTAALWGHLLHKKPHTALAAKISDDKRDSVPPMKPVDKAGTSVRMLLHDTQAVLEKFSGRIDKLHGEVEKARQEVSTSHKVFQHGHDKLVSDQVELVNRCQTQLQKSVGKPAQVANVEEVLQNVVSLNQKFDGLDRRIDALNMLNQTQLRALQAIQEQQGQLLALLSPVVPLVEAIPLHINAAKNDLKDRIHQAQPLTAALQDSLVNLKDTVTTSLGSLTSALHHFPPCSVPRVSRSPSCPPRSTPAKRKSDSCDSSPRKSTKRVQHDLRPSQNEHSQMIVDQLAFGSIHSSLVSPISSLQTAMHSHSYETSSTLTPDQSYSNQSKSLLPSFSVSDALLSDESALDNISYPLHQTSPPHPSTGYPECGDALSSVAAVAPIHSVTGSLGDNSGAPTDPPPTIDSPVKDVSLPASPTRIDSYDRVYALEAAHSSAEMMSSMQAKVTPSELSAISPSSVDQVPESNTTAPNKPMSLRDRRARDPMLESSMRNVGKRFICVEDLDEDEFDGDIW